MGVVGFMGTASGNEKEKGRFDRECIVTIPV